MPGLPPPPPDLNLSETDQARILGVTIGTYILAIITVGLRLLSRRLIRLKLWWDDWLIVLALLWASVIALVGVAYMEPHGLGKHVWVTPPNSVLVWATALFIGQIAYALLIVTIKFSVLCFYWRIFQYSSLRAPIFILGGIVASWGVAVILISIFQCRPVSFQWRQYAPTNPGVGICTVDATQFFIGNSIPNIVTDAALVVLPIPSVLRLKLQRAQKIALVLVFLLGVFVVGVSIARLTFIINLDLTSPDVTWNFRHSEVWTSVESHIGIVCACMPSLRPILSIVTTGSVDRESAAPDRSDFNRKRLSNLRRRQNNAVASDTCVDGRPNAFKSAAGQESIELQCSFPTSSSSAENSTKCQEEEEEKEGEETGENAIKVTTDIKVECLHI